MKNWLKVTTILLLTGLVLFSNSLNNKFLIDDFPFLHNPVWSSTKFILSQWNPYREQASGVVDSHEMQSYYRPMQHMLLDFSYATFKHNYWQYHLLNIILFVLASSLIYLFVDRLTGNFNVAFLTSFFYLIHPVNGIIVNYVSASVFPFQLIFLLGTILLLLKSLDNKNDRGLYLLSLLLSFLFLFWHESGIMLPFYVTAVILFVRKEPLRKKAACLVPYYLIVISYLAFRYIYLAPVNAFLKSTAAFHLTLWEYWANFDRVYMWYLGQMFYPQGIVMSWTTPIVHDHISWYVLEAFLLFMLFLLLFMRLNKVKTLQVAIVWTVIGLAPVGVAAFIMPDNGVQIEPHWFVISSIGFFILAAYFCAYILDRSKNAGLTLLFILIFMWGAISHANNQLWADQRTYALYWSNQVPNLKSAYFYLADSYQSQGAYQESQKYYKLLLTGHRSDEEIYNNLGVIDEHLGHLKDAEINYKKALKMAPDSASTYCNLGTVYLEQGMVDKARGYFDRSLALNPLLIEPRRSLARIFLSRSDYQKANELCLENLDIVNDDLKTLYLLIDISIQKKDLNDLKKYANRILSSENDPRSLTNLGISLAQNNAADLALDSFEKAIRIDPRDTDAYLAAGSLFANYRRYDEAINIWKDASAIDPSDQRFEQNIKRVMMIKGLGPTNADQH